MITRRNIRIKVMQVLYQLYVNEQLVNNATKILNNNLNQTSRLFTYLIYFLTEVARYAEKDASVRAAKHLATLADKNINIKLAGNTLLWKILENNSYKKALADYKFNFEQTGNLVRKIYNELTTSSLYQSYINSGAREPQTERDILTFIFTDLMLPDEDFISHIEEYFTNWDDDAEMLQVLMLGFLQKPSSLNLQEMPDKEKDAFAKNLLNTVMEKKDYVNALIKARLKNWDPERIAALDMILMQMGVCEFLYFPTIPPKVTINEYIDLAKEYSTAQSGQFVNGILDGIHKDLLKENKIHKSDFKPKKAN
ncbi:MAG TPA: transcription antitermination factor NusB [Parafilimonas sp.]|nr:transcription antitermination factor NusB [Parafilimonas sp.]